MSEPRLRRDEALEAVRAAARALHAAEALLVGAGAGMSVDSGIPAFRLNPDRQRQTARPTKA